MNTLLQNWMIPIAPQATAMSKTARAWALLASLLVVAVSVNAAIILINGV